MRGERVGGVWTTSVCKVWLVLACSSVVGPFERLTSEAADGDGGGRSASFQPMTEAACGTALYLQSSVETRRPVADRRLASTLSTLRGDGRAAIAGESRGG